MSDLLGPSMNARRRRSRPIWLWISLGVMLLAGGGFVVYTLFPCVIPVGARGNCGPCQDAGPVTWVLGARDNMPAPMAVGANSPVPQIPERVRDLVREAIDAEKRLLVFRVDGDPTSAFDHAYDPIAEADGPRRDEVEALTNEFLTTITTVRATTAEANPLRALWLAARDTPPGGTIIFHDSGLQTTEPLDFRRDGALEAVPAEVVEELRFEHEAIPDFAGRRVVLLGVGDTADPQGDLTVRMHNNVVQIWEAIVAAGGAACVETLTDNPFALEALADVPPVSVIPFETAPPPPLPPGRECEPIRLSNGGDVGFEPDRDQFLDRTAAMAYLTGIADTILEYSQYPVIVIGTTARWGSEAGQRDLSLRRAEAVKGLLVELGVPAGRITTQGDGSYGPYYRDDNGPDGPLDSANAAFNRSVYIQLICPSTAP